MSPKNNTAAFTTAVFAAAIAVIAASAVVVVVEPAILLLLQCYCFFATAAVGIDVISNANIVVAVAAGRTVAAGRRQVMLQTQTKPPTVLVVACLIVFTISLCLFARTEAEFWLEMFTLPGLKCNMSSCCNW